MNRPWRRSSLLVGGVLTVAMVAMALVSLVWTPYPPTKIDILHKLAAPSAAHLLGTDPFGRDVLSMIMAGARSSLSVALIAVVVGAGIGIPLGALASAMGGWIDNLVMRATDLAFAFPALLTAVMITALAGPGAVNAMLAIGIFNIPVFARVARGAALAVRAQEFVMAARATGRGEAAIMWRHVLPNISAVLLVQATIQFALAIVADAGLSYLGLGTQPPFPSWGRMLNDAQTFIYRAPLLAVFPGVAITLSVLGLNLLGDGLRDLLDPRLSRER
ncbi:ABC transporter permease [Limobrevibacterium gyesilva]|uniref:ABC transporter permease n=1 Tax=Limobrevibacterium gyesilva TaxID=2991712 RepID=A0AA41YMJ0_9PROT|nr:ABC transporter permease [Limobrevibacterium gyesilva]MCW3475072.1 ABC transporter permease [Limobrevibacterium gyesilva]